MYTRVNNTFTEPVNFYRTNPKSAHYKGFYRGYNPLICKSHLELSLFIIVAKIASYNNVSFTSVNVVDSEAEVTARRMQTQKIVKDTFKNSCVHI